MLELKNINKTYRPKNGVPVQALKDISLKLDNTGMVFILGKSGCGKSTLLNIIGGLDKYDSGEIIIKGKSSNEFSGSDFDSYRNTFIGFIFQEYNILSEFNIEKNIALALELQGKKATTKNVHALLEQVDLKTEAKRRTTELSGGQKQRVAIARALIKEPEIIIADEPTGALDSATGRQVFDTLKKLSKDKLVIIVSHDREYAESYADRIIEMKDGIIISDETKRFLPPKEVTGGLNVIGGDIIQIEKGQELSIEELRAIGEFIKQNDGEVLISKNQTKNSKIKEVCKISDDGRTETFSQTKNEDFTNTQYNKNDLKLIKSKLKLKDSFKMGASGLKSKPIRLIFTIFLSMIAFTLFGIADTLAAYNKNTVTVNSIIDSNYKTLALTTSVKTRNLFRDYYTNAKSSDSDLVTIKEEFGLNAKPVYSGHGSSFSLYNMFTESDKIRTGIYSGSVYNGEIKGVAEYTQSELSNMGYTIIGEMPSNIEEIAITKYTYSQFKLAGLKEFPGSTLLGTDITNNTYTPSDIVSEESIIGKYINLNGYNFKITAVVDTKLDLSKYSEMQDYGEYKTNSINTDMKTSYLAAELNSLITYNTSSLAFVASGTIDKFRPLLSETNEKFIVIQTPVNSDSLQSSAMEITNTIKFSTLSPSEYYLFDGQSLDSNNMLKDNEYLIDIMTVSSYIMYGSQYNFSSSPETQKYYNDYIGGGAERINLLTNPDYLSWIVTSGLMSNVVPAMNEDATNTNIVYVPDNTKKFVGFYLNTEQSGIIIGNDDYFNTSVKGVYSFIIADTPTSKASLTNVIKKYYQIAENDELYSHYNLINPVMTTLSVTNDFVEDSTLVFIYIGVGFAVFAALMLMNFISTSISYKKREIGILRAIGARKKDVFSIFYNESLIIALINFVLSSAATFGAVYYINYTLRAEAGLNLTLLTFSIRQVIFILLVSILVAFVASAIPVFKIARKQPIDAINNR